MPNYHEIFAVILKAYINNYVSEEPIKDTSFVRPSVGDCCNDRFSLNRFLIDPIQTVGRFSINEKWRGRLHRKLDTAKIDCTHETERRGSPYTLVVTKTFRHYERAMTEWKKRKAEGKARLIEFNKNNLTVWFGEEHDQLMSMLGLAKFDRPARNVVPPSQSLAPIPPNQQKRAIFDRPKGYSWLRDTGTGTKRKAADMDVVDLRGDD